MLEDLADGTVDAVLVYHIDRLTRRPIELEEFLAVVDQAKVRHVRLVTGDTDIQTGDGLLVARIMAAVAANGSAGISRRVRRKMDQVAAEGRPHGGSTRPYGYAADKVTVVPEEAAIIRTIVARFLAGESIRSLCLWLERDGIVSATGKAWTSTALRAMLTSGRIAGLRVHRGQVIGPAIWEAIITEDEHRRILAKFAARQNTGRRTPQRYLLSGLLRCGKCGNRLYSRPRGETRRYACMSGPDHGNGCGRLTVVADPLERLVADAVLYRLDTPALADTLAGRNSTDERTGELSRAVDQAQEQLEELAHAYAERAITMREWMTAKAPIQKRQENAQRQLASLTRSDALAGLVGNGQQLGASWNSLNLSRQHAITAALVDHVDIAPGTPGVRTLDRARVNIVWRL